MTRHALFGALVALSTSVAFEGCASVDDKDSESHFLCASDEECARFGAGQKCIERHCRPGNEPMDAALDTSTSSDSDGQAGTGGSGAGGTTAKASGGSVGSSGTSGDASANLGSGGTAADANADVGSDVSPDVSPDGGDGGARDRCALDDTWFAMMTEIDASYGQQPGMWAAGFTGKVRLLALTHIPPGTYGEAGATTLSVDLRVCGLQIPDFTIPDFMVAPLGANASVAQVNTLEVYGVTFPNALWDNWGTDPSYTQRRTTYSLSAPSLDLLTLGEIAVPLGAVSSGPMNLPNWPSIYGSDYARFINGSFDPWEQVDMDRDGHPGITGVAKTGPIPPSSEVYTAQGAPDVLALIDQATTYSMPLADTTSERRRASEIYFGMRAITLATQPFITQIKGCDEIAWMTEGGSAVQHHTVGCRLGEGPGAPQDCPTLTTATFDNWVPQFTPGMTHFTAKRLSNPPTTLMSPTACTPARQAFSATFPP